MRNYRMMIEYLVPDEVVLLRNIMWYTLHSTDFTDYLDSDNYEIYQKLYEKVMDV
jgi:hypothetical protein